MDCREAARFVQLQLDDEIEAGDGLHLEQHLDDCPHCRRQVHAEAWSQVNIRNKLREAQDHDVHRAPAQLRVSVLAQTEAERDAGRFPYGRAAAACMALFMVGALSWGATSSEARIVEETVSRHSKNLPPEVRANAADERGVHRFLHKNLRYRVAVPRFRRAVVRTRLVGARLSSIGDRDVAYMMYDHRGARVSVFAFPSREAASDPHGFQQHNAGRHTVYVGRRRGYNVLSWKDRDFAWSMVSNVDSNELVRLVSTVGYR